MIKVTINWPLPDFIYIRKCDFGLYRVTVCSFYFFECTDIYLELHETEGKIVKMQKIEPVFEFLFITVTTNLNSYDSLLLKKYIFCVVNVHP